MQMSNDEDKDLNPLMCLCIFECNFPPFLEVFEKIKGGKKQVNWKKFCQPREREREVTFISSLPLGEIGGLLSLGNC